MSHKCVDASYHRAIEGLNAWTSKLTDRVNSGEEPPRSPSCEPKESSAPQPTEGYPLRDVIQTVEKVSAYNWGWAPLCDQRLPMMVDTAASQFVRAAEDPEHEGELAPEVAARFAAINAQVGKCLEDLLEAANELLEYDPD